MPPPQADLQQVSALVMAQAAARTNLTIQATSLATAATAKFAGWYDTDQITEWAAALAALIEPVQRVIAQSTDAYLARLLSLLTEKPVRPTGAVDVTALRRGVTHAGAYGRAADVYRWQQAQADRAALALLQLDHPTVPTLESPAGAAADRVAAVANMDALLAFQAQSQQNMQDAADRELITGYRRVIHPERSKGGTCGLCIAASDRLYGPIDLMPIHDRCECTTVPVLEHDDPGSRLNTADLRDLYKAAGSTGRADLKRTRYQVDEHGELGPLLNPAGAKVRSARQAQRATDAPRQARSADEKRAALVSLRDSLAPARDKARQLADADPAAWNEYAVSLEARVEALTHDLAA